MTKRHKNKRAKSGAGRIQRLRAWHKRKMAEKREDFATMTGNVHAITRAVAAGKAAPLRELKPVRTPIGGFRFSKSKSRRRRSSRDEACPVTKRSSYPVEAPPETSRRHPGSRAQYARQVILLMRSGHGLSAQSSVRLVAKWHRLIDTAWRAQKTACWSADHVVKYDDRGMCPCEFSSRDCTRCTRRPRKGKR
jgi:hypothetical protein